MSTVRLADGGIETSLIFHQGIDLPLFAAFPLAEHQEGRSALRAYWRPYLAIAHELDLPMVVDTPTWRANPDWAEQLGYGEESLRSANAAAAELAAELAGELEQATVNGVVGPRGDGYVVGRMMTVDEAAVYHSQQLRALAAAGVEQATALTLTYPEEAIGFVEAANATGLPAVVSFTVETDGRLPNGDSLRSAVELVDERTASAPRGFMINCAHPTHFASTLQDEGEWLHRITGVRANASRMSHAELDVAEELDDGDPRDLADRYADLMELLPALELLGGCCGTDERHIRAIAVTCCA